ncbi:hypothetical protein HYQ44_010660 [Verticillium longisporum]|nr:hypothetical protein HYQ44_010660 [Verticillium longisporum]
MIKDCVYFPFQPRWLASWAFKTLCISRNAFFLVDGNRTRLHVLEVDDGLEIVRIFALVQTVKDDVVMVKLRLLISDDP